SHGLLGLGLVASIWLQLRYGLGPVRALRDAVARVRSGETGLLPADQPRELQPLADEVNALIRQNAAGLDHARRHLANLAHGLKTPLATLSLRLARDDAPAETRALVAQLDARIAHHLRRARSAAATTGQRARTNVAEVAADLIDAVVRVHADRALRFEADIEPSHIAAIDRQDLDELLGNLLDNAARHAGSLVRLSARTDGTMLDLAVEDDGPGMTEEQVTLALRPGARLDESGIGYGLGLSIVHELAELYGGTLRLGRSQALGGLLAGITLPRRP
ncbi:MAG: sensor histidine kinase, partial [Alphaproteobacteria bacterium]|nr:sensor histidine kinase [Alphaproteobacteria bacterium]